MKAVLRIGVLTLVALLFLSDGWLLFHPAPVEAQQSTYRAVLLNAATTGTSSPAAVAGRRGLVLYLRGTGTISSGVVTIEEADYDPSREAVYGGTWASITTINANTVTGGAQGAYHFTGLSYRFIRARITTPVGGGGSVTAVIAGY